MSTGRPGGPKSSTDISPPREGSATRRARGSYSTDPSMASLIAVTPGEESRSSRNGPRGRRIAGTPDGQGGACRDDRQQAGDHEAFQVAALQVAQYARAEGRRGRPDLVAEGDPA